MCLGFLPQMRMLLSSTPNLHQAMHKRISHRSAHWLHVLKRSINVAFLLTRKK